MDIVNKTVDFVRSLYNETSAFIPLHAPVFQGNEKKYLNECVDSTFVSSVGKFVDEFEKRISEYTGAKKAVVCVNGTNALHLALQLVGVEEGDEVLTQALTFIATANAINYCGANPVFIDVNKQTLGLCPEALSQFLEGNAELKGDACYNKHTGRRIKACVPMHTFGHPCMMDELLELCAQYHIELVEDAAESLGSYYKGKHTGVLGRVGVLSFNGNKVMTTGGGGMLLFTDEELASKAKHLTTQAKVAHPWEFSHDLVGYNYRMPNINAALGLAQLEQLNHFLENKRTTAMAYRGFFEGIDELTFFEEPEDCKSNYWLNVVLLKDRGVQQAFLKGTNDAGVMTRPIWRLMNKLPMYQHCQCGELTNSEWLEDRIVNIPSSVKLL